MPYPMMDRVYLFFRLGQYHYEYKQKVSGRVSLFIYNSSFFMPYNLKMAMNGTSLSTIAFLVVLPI